MGGFGRFLRLFPEWELPASLVDLPSKRKTLRINLISGNNNLADQSGAPDLRHCGETVWYHTSDSEPHGLLCAAQGISIFCVTHGQSVTSEPAEHNRCLYPSDKVLMEMLRDHPLQMFHCANRDVANHIEMA